MPVPDKDRWETDEDVGPVGAGVPRAVPGPSQHRARSKSITLMGFTAPSPSPTPEPSASSPPPGTVSGVQMIARESRPNTLDPTARFTRDELEKARELAMKSISPSPQSAAPTPAPVLPEASSMSHVIVHQHPPFFRRLWYAFARWCLVYIFGEKPRS